MTTFTQAKNLLTRFSIPKSQHWKAIFGKIEEIETGSGGGIYSGEFVTLEPVADYVELLTALNILHDNGNIAPDVPTLYLVKLTTPNAYVIVNWNGWAFDSRSRISLMIDVGGEVVRLFLGEQDVSSNAKPLAEVGYRLFQVFGHDLEQQLPIGTSYKMDLVYLGREYPLDTVFSSNQLRDSGIGGCIQVKSSSAVNYTIPTLSNFFNQDIRRNPTTEIINFGTGLVTLVPASGVTINTSLPDLTIPTNEKRFLTRSFHDIDTWVLTS